MIPKPKHALEWLVCHAFVGGCFLLPLALGMAYESGTMGELVERPSERTVTYMASMSMIPFPDPDAEVLEVTDELLEKPKPSSTDASPDDAEGSEVPLEATETDGNPAPEKGRPETTPTAEQVEQVKSGGKSKGPTQDGDGAKAQECLPDNPNIKPAKKALTWRVKRDLVDYYTTHLNEATSLAATYWQKGKEGQTVGFKVRRIRCGNDLYQMGFRGNDVIRQVNGEPVTSIPQAIKAYRRVRKDDRLVIVIRRNHEEMVLTYILTD